MKTQPNFAPVLLRSALILLPIIIGLLAWMFRERGFLSAIVDDPITATAPPANLDSAEPTVAPPSQPPYNSAALAKTAWASLFLTTSLDALTWDLRKVDPRVIPSSEWFAPPSKTLVPPPPNPRQLRAIMDRGVVSYASASTEAAQVRAAYRIQAAASAGYGPAGDLIAHLYPQSGAIRKAVPPVDAIRYALAMLAARSIALDDSKRVLRALADYFATQGQLATFATHLVGALRDDRRPQLSYRIDVILEQLEHVPGTCAALARTVSAPEGSADECTASLNEKIMKYIEMAGPTGRDAEMRRRAMQMMDQFVSTR